MAGVGVSKSPFRSGRPTGKTAERTDSAPRRINELVVESLGGSSVGEMDKVAAVNASDSGASRVLGYVPYENPPALGRHLRERMS